MWSSAAVLAGLTNSSTGLDDPESEDNEKLSGPKPPTPPPLLLQPREGVRRGRGERKYKNQLRNPSGKH